MWCCWKGSAVPPVNPPSENEAFPCSSLNAAPRSNSQRTVVTCWLSRYLLWHPPGWVLPSPFFEVCTGWSFGIYSLVMTKSLPWDRWPIDIDGLPNLKMVIFYGYVSHNQRVIAILWFNCEDVIGIKCDRCIQLTLWIQRMVVKHFEIPVLIHS